LFISNGCTDDRVIVEFTSTYTTSAPSTN
jgi:hypothetical protein